MKRVKSLVIGQHATASTTDNCHLPILGRKSGISILRFKDSSAGHPLSIEERRVFRRPKRETAPQSDQLGISGRLDKVAHLSTI